MDKELDMVEVESRDEEDEEEGSVRLGTLTSCCYLSLHFCVKNNTDQLSIANAKNVFCIQGCMNDFYII